MGRLACGGSVYPGERPDARLAEWWRPVVCLRFIRVFTSFQLRAGMGHNYGDAGVIGDGAAASTEVTCEDGAGGGRQRSEPARARDAVEAEGVRGRRGRERGRGAG